jgi:hypothetical protein
MLRKDYYMLGKDYLHHCNQFGTGVHVPIPVGRGDIIRRTQKPGATMSSRRGLAPGGLYSLWDIMNRFFVARACQAFADVLGISIKMGRENIPLSEDHRKYILEEIFPNISLHCVQGDLVETAGMLKRISAELDNSPTCGEVAFGLGHLADLMRSEMKKRVFLALDVKLIDWFHDPSDMDATKFGDEVDEAFPSTRNDAIEATKCLAFKRNNAAVYHLMCVAEVGLRVLAWDRRIRPKYKQTEYPLELAQWGELIKGLEGKLKEIENWSRTLAREDALKFYNYAVVEARTFNDGWRRHVMHGRSHVYTTDAIALWGHVQRFMKTLSGTISEQKRTPKVWARPRQIVS